jgi:hypothetical protein
VALYEGFRKDDTGRWALTLSRDFAASRLTYWSRWLVLERGDMFHDGITTIFIRPSVAGFRPDAVDVMFVDATIRDNPVMGKESIPRYVRPLFCVGRAIRREVPDGETLASPL